MTLEEAKQIRERAIGMAWRDGLGGFTREKPPVPTDPPAWLKAGVFITHSRTRKPVEVLAVSDTVCVLRDEEMEWPADTEKVARFWRPAEATPER